MSTVKNARKASRGTGTRKAGRGANWVDFKEIKRSITMEMVLERYGLLSELKKSGRNLVGCCPIHQGSNPRQFSVDPRKNIFNCFGNCRSGGNVLDFVAKMENVPLRQAGLKLKDWFSAGSGAVSKESKKKEPMNDTKQTTANEEINPPLTFKLKNVVPNHPFFRESGISQDTIVYFDLGFCSRGMMKDRIVIPIHNETGELVAYSGRAVTPDQIKEEGKYKLPPKFVKSAVVYNLNRLAKNENTVFFSRQITDLFSI